MNGDFAIWDPINNNLTTLQKTKNGAKPILNKRHPELHKR